MSGREAADAIRLARPEMKVLYVSGYADDAVAPPGLCRAARVPRKALRARRPAARAPRPPRLVLGPARREVRRWRYWLTCTTFAGGKPLNQVAEALL